MQMQVYLLTDTPADASIPPDLHICRWQFAFWLTFPQKWYVCIWKYIFWVVLQQTKYAFLLILLMEKVCFLADTPVDESIPSDWHLCRWKKPSDGRSCRWKYGFWLTLLQIKVCLLTVAPAGVRWRYAFWIILLQMKVWFLTDMLTDASIHCTFRLRRLHMQVYLLSWKCAWLTCLQMKWCRRTDTSADESMSLDWHFCRWKYVVRLTLLQMKVYLLIDTFTDESRPVTVRAAFICTGLPIFSSLRSLYLEIGWETPAERRKTKKLILMYKIVNEETPSYLKDYS